MAGMGFNVYRFSVCWSRIFPLGTEEKPNAEGLSFYERVIDRLHERGIEPLITIYHDEMPAHLALQNDGWSSRGTVYAASAIYPATCKTEDVWACTRQHRETYYFIDVIGGDKNPYLPATPWCWPIDPLCLCYVMNEFWERYQKPVFIVENGIGAVDEVKADGTIDYDYRIDYMRSRLRAMLDAICYDGVKCLGYTMWAPIDLVSLSTGVMQKHYGFFEYVRSKQWQQVAKQPPNPSPYYGR